MFLNKGIWFFSYFESSDLNVLVTSSGRGGDGRLVTFGDKGEG